MNDTQTLTLTDFLLARIAEDEAVAKGARAHEYLSPARDASPLRWVRDTLGYGTIFANSGRVLAECEAKRRIVEMHSNPFDEGEGRPVCTSCGRMDIAFAETKWPCSTILALASIYADHRRFREEWRL